MEKPTFTYAPRGCQWAVLKWEYLPNGSRGTTILYKPDKKTARELAQKLNEEYAKTLAIK